MPYLVPVEEITPLLPEWWQAKAEACHIKHGVNFKQGLKLRNHCHGCGKRWTSMKGVAEFRVGKSRSGQTHFMSCHVYRQQCKQCGVYSDPSYYSQEFKDIVQNVLQRFMTPLVQPMPIRKKTGNPRGLHLYCEACALGVVH